MNLDGEVCLDRFSRYGLYGYGDDQMGDIPGYHRPPKTQWRHVDWWSLQSKCFRQNENRYRTLSIDAAIRKGKVKPGASNDRLHPRSAVLIRTWHDMPWTSSDIQYLRSIIVELALHSGAEYQVFLLCHVRDGELSLDSEEDIDAIKDKYIPREFWNMVVFFNDKMLKAWYPKIEEHKYARCRRFIFARLGELLLTAHSPSGRSSNISNQCKSSRRSTPTSITSGSSKWTRGTSDIYTTS
jgi:hypothetical protein